MESISEIERNDLEFLHDLASEYGIEYFNVRMGQGTSTTFSILNGITKIARNGSSRGFSIQTFKKGGWGLALGHDFKKKSLEYVFKESAKLAAFSAKYTNEIYEIPNISVENNEFKIEQKIPFTQVGADEKIKFLLDLEKNAKIEPRIKTTRLNYSDGSGEAIYFNGAKFLRMKKSASFIIFESIAKEGVNQQRYHETHGGLGGFEVMKKRQDLGKAASQNALELLESTSIKAGKYDIIMDPSLTGTFIHEAFGHACEADAIIAGESLLVNKIGERVGGKNITVIDDSTLQGEFGYSPYDHEGTKGQKTVLVENGTLKNYLHSLETASKMGKRPTGNARASGYGSRPIVRMTNTYLDGGDSSLEEMLEELGNGILCVNWNYGYTDPTDGSFMFKMAKGYLIEDGKKTQVVRDAAISGMTLDVLDRVQLLGEDVIMDPGHCGKGSQTASVGSGGPYTLIRDMVLGGQ